MTADLTYLALLRRVCEDPGDTFARLVLADWLEKRGDPRSEFIRVQCELAQPCQLGYSDAYHVDETCSACDPLSARERELLQRHGGDWIAESGLPPGEVCIE